MKYIKTYGMKGLLEWHGIVQSGSIKLNVSFTNGSVTAFGVAPATFTTRNELHQIIIENSEMFKNGRIFIYSSSVIPGSEREETAMPQEPAHVAQQQDSPNVTEPKAAPISQSETNNPERQDEGAELLDEASDNTEDGTTENDDREVVRVSDKNEAIEWLKGRHPEKEYNATKLRTKTAFEEACREAKVRFEFE